MNFKGNPPPTYRPWLERRKLQDGTITYDLRWFDADYHHKRECTGLRCPIKASEKARADVEAYARVALHRKREELKNGPVGEDEESDLRQTTLKIASGKWLDYIHAMTSRRTAYLHEHVMADWLEWMADRRRTPTQRAVRTLKPADIDEYAVLMLERGLAKSTVKKRIGAIGQFIDWCVRQGIASRPIDTTQLRKHLRVSHRPPPPLMTTQVQKILRAFTDPPQRHSLWLLAATGLRCGELAGLPRGAWRPEERVLVVPHGQDETTKGHGRIVPLGEFAGKLADELQAIAGGPLEWSGVPLTGINNQCIVNWWLKDFPDPARDVEGKPPAHVTPKRFRQWFHTQLVLLGAPEFVLRGLMGHAPTMQESHYQFVGTYTPERARPWVQKVEAVLLG